MSTHEEGIIREAAAAAQMARLHGCAIDVDIKRFGHRTTIRISPEGDWAISQDDAFTGEQTQIMGGDRPRDVASMEAPE